jgi:hypothetical protein
VSHVFDPRVDPLARTTRLGTEVEEPHVGAVLLGEGVEVLRLEREAVLREELVHELEPKRHLGGPGGLAARAKLPVELVPRSVVLRLGERERHRVLERVVRPAGGARVRHRERGRDALG